MKGGERKEWQRILDAALMGLLSIITTALIVLALLIIGGCSRKVVYVPSESSALRVDTFERVVVKVERDTLRESREVYVNSYDSIAPILDSLNRVIGWDRYHFRESTEKDSRLIARLSAEIDSLRSAKVDSVMVREPYAVEVVKEVKRPLRLWQKALMGVGGAAVTALVLLLIWLVKRKR